MTTKEKFLKDYKQPNFWTEKVDLTFDILKDKTVVTSQLYFRKNPNTNDHNLFLNGIDLKLISIQVDSKALDPNEYTIHNDGISLVMSKDSFLLKTVVEINPYNNLSCEGLYKSGNILCTQNEPEGFRKITYFQDRPDDMTVFRTTVKADKAIYPYLLANGNKIDEGDLEDNKHFCIWEDPHKKPSYLFALVAGDLSRVSDTFTTKSGNEVALEIFVDAGNENRSAFAMQSLKDSMKWDEEKFGLEYDLDIYMIVAVDSFNMGAMENKGLNIFNSAYVLANSETGTDSDFQGIQAVIGHEYFHNWTGNRVTCRDWFQLTLKEGLTVFRDQEFSADMLSRSVKRIEDVEGLRINQFVEDSGPTSHPIKPKSYIEMNNFYTYTVYEKGAEIIRMIHTLIGEEAFRKGMDLYFELFDGHAVTTEDFVSSMSKASGVNLDQFLYWYDQNGTPVLDIQSSYDETAKKYTLTIKQSSVIKNKKFSELMIPFHFSLYSVDGEKFDHKEKHILVSESTSIICEDIKSLPIPSFNLNFSAPVIINYEYSDHDLFALIKHSKDEFNRYDATQMLFKRQIKKGILDYLAGTDLTLDSNFIEAFGSLLKDDSISNAFKAYAIGFESVKSFNSSLEKYQLDESSVVINFIKNELGLIFQNELIDIINSLQSKESYVFDSESVGKRMLKAVCLDFLVSSKTSTGLDLTFNIYQNALNMTDEYNSFNLLVKFNNPYREKVKESFYNKWKNHTLVIQKWFSSIVNADDITIDELLNLEKLDVYDNKVPNLIRSLVGQFVSSNMINFNKLDGSGYGYLTQKILEIDEFNPQIAAGLAKRMSHKSRLDEARKKELIKCLKQIRDRTGISSDTLEIVELNLK